MSNDLTQSPLVIDTAVQRRERLEAICIERIRGVVDDGSSYSYCN